MRSLQGLLAAMLELRIEAELAAHPNRRRLSIDHHQRVAVDDVLFEVEPHLLRRPLQNGNRRGEVSAGELAAKILRELDVAAIGVDEDELFFGWSGHRCGVAWRALNDSTEGIEYDRMKLAGEQLRRLAIGDGRRIDVGPQATAYRKAARCPLETDAA